jgi:hypothetical protein
MLGKKIPTSSGRKLHPKFHLMSNYIFQDKSSKNRKKIVIIKIKKKVTTWKTNQYAPFEDRLVFFEVNRSYEL